MQVKLQESRILYDHIDIYPKPIYLFHTNENRTPSSLDKKQVRNTKFYCLAEGNRETSLCLSPRNL